MLKTARQARENPSQLFGGPYLDASSDALEKAGIRCLIVNNIDSPVFVGTLKAELGPKLERVAVFSPYRDKTRTRSGDRWGTTAAPHLAGELFARERLGLYLEIYKVSE